MQLDKEMNIPYISIGSDEKYDEASRFTVSGNSRKKNSSHLICDKVCKGISIRVSSRKNL